MFYEYAPDMKLHYKIIGKGKPILLIHGLACDMNLMLGAFEPVFTKESHNYQRIYLDLPGMGESSHTLTYASSDKILAVLEGFVDKVIGKESFLLAGQSFGGYLSRGLLAHYKFQVDGVALLCPMVIPDRKQRILPKQYLNFADEAYLKKLEPRQAEKISNNLIISNKETIERQQKELILGIKKANKEFLQVLRNNYSFVVNVDKVIAEMAYDKPSLIMTGRQDTRVGYQDQWQLVSIFPRASYVVLDTADHSLQIEQPKVFNALVENWLERVVKFA